MARRRRDTFGFGMSFLDAMTCGLGAVVLLYMIINASVALRAGRAKHDLSEEAERLESQVFESNRDLVGVRDELRQVDRRRDATRALSEDVLARLEELRRDLAEQTETTLAKREHLEKLKSDLEALKKDTQRLAASTPKDEERGDVRRGFVGDGDRQYLTGLKVGGERILILLDTSASMLAEDLVNVLLRRNLPEEDQRRSGKWRRAVATVDWLLTQLPEDSHFQVYTFDDEARPALASTAGTWLDGGDADRLDEVVEALRTMVPTGGTNLFRAFTAISRLDPEPDNVLLIVDGLPTQGERPGRGTVTGRDRVKLFNRAVRELPHHIPVNVILFPMEGDPLAAPAYWKLALWTRGSFMSPARDWP